MGSTSRAVVLWLLVTAASFGAAALVNHLFGIWVMVAFCLALSGLFALVGARRRRKSGAAGGLGR